MSKRPPRPSANGHARPPSGPLPRPRHGRGLEPGPGRSRIRSGIPIRRPGATRPPGTSTASPGDFAAQWGWDREFEVYSDFDLPTYVGPPTFSNLPWVTDPAELAARANVDVAIVGAPFDDMVTPPARARASARARSARRSTRSGASTRSSCDVEPFEVLTVVDAGDANIVPAYWIERGHAMIYRKVREVAATGAIPIVLGGDHSITWPSRDARSPRCAARAASASSTSTPTPTPRRRLGRARRATARRCAG